MLAVAIRRTGTIAAVIAAGAALAIAAFGGRSASADDTGRVRVMHASPDTPAVDIFVDGAKAVTALAFPKNTGYVTLPAGVHNVKVFVSPSDGRGTPALEANLDVKAGKDYTVLATGLLAGGTLGLLPLEDNNALPAAGTAHVRLIHASADAPPVDVVVKGTTTKVFTGVAFNNFAGPNPVLAGTYDLQVQVNPSGPSVLDIPGLKLNERTVYTVVATGLAGNGTLAVQALVDAQPAAPKPPHTGGGAAIASSSGAQWAIVAGATLAVLSLGGLAVARRK